MMPDKDPISPPSWPVIKKNKIKKIKNGGIIMRTCDNRYTSIGHQTGSQFAFSYSHVAK